MKAMIDKIMAKFKGEIENFFSQPEASIEQAEEYFVPRISQVVTELLSAYYEQVDAALLEDRAGRREAGSFCFHSGYITMIRDFCQSFFCFFGSVGASVWRW